MKQDSNAVFVFAILLTLLVTNLALWGLSVAGIVPFDVADYVGVSVFDALLWSFAWRNAQKRSKLDNSSQARS